VTTGAKLDLHRGDRKSLGLNLERDRAEQAAETNVKRSEPLPSGGYGGRGLSLFDRGVAGALLFCLGV
jgi:hypothetical protein